ncbi:MAG: ABC transporter ATP-binding protein [Variovorax sp.]
MNVSSIAAVSLQGVDKSYGDARVVDRLQLEVKQGEFLTLLGPSGCGKTTTLRMIAGFVRPTAGRVHIQGKDVTDVPPRDRNIGMVFQDYALFPHLTVAENIAFGLIERRSPRGQIASRVDALLKLIRLEGLEKRLPVQLSGGQQQRVALARAIAHPPQVLLLDEPLGALDLKMREHMQVEVRRIQQELGLTAVYVTHDQTEAMTMSDRVAVMNGGRLEQIGSPESIYDAPQTRFVASFIGKVNYLEGRLIASVEGQARVETPVGICVCPVGAARVGDAVTLAIRPEHMVIEPADGGTPSANRVAATVLSTTYCGNLRQYIADLRGQDPVLIETRAGDRVWPIGEAVQLTWKPQHCVIIAQPAEH